MSHQVFRCPRTNLRYRVRDESDWPHSQAKLLSFEISINNPNCSDQYLRCQLYWGNLNFQRFEFSVGDTLNEYNYRALGHPQLGVLSPAAATQIATLEGENWIKRHMSIIDEELPPGSYQIYRWNDWRSHPHFGARLKEVQALYSAYEEFRLAVQADIESYIKRRSSHLNMSPAATETLAMHTLEELAVYYIQAEEGPAVILYPGSMPNSYRLLQHNPRAPHALANQHYRYIEIRGN